MNQFKILVFVLALASFTFACEKEQLQPEGPSAALRGNTGIVRPTNQCGDSEFTNVIDGSGTNFGTIELANDGTNLHVMITMNTNRFLDEVKVFVGNAGSSLDVDGEGTVSMENFNFQTTFRQSHTTYTVILPTAGLGACSDVIFWGRCSTRNHFGQVTSRRNVWLDGLPFHNLETVKYCFGNCGGTIPLTTFVN